MLRCPNCRELMEQENATGHYGAKLQLFHCASCSGIWVDRDVAFALSRDSALQADSEAEPDEIVTKPHEVPRYCPRCEIYLTEQTGMNVPAGLHIDYCTTCHGFWFDKGELMIYKTYLDEKLMKSKERARKSEAMAKEKKQRKEKLKQELNPKVDAWQSMLGYYPGLTVARQLINIWRLLR